MHLVGLTLSTAEDSLNFLIFLPPSLRFWGCQYVTPCLIYAIWGWNPGLQLCSPKTLPMGL